MSNALRDGKKSHWAGSYFQWRVVRPVRRLLTLGCCVFIVGLWKEKKEKMNRKKKRRKERRQEEKRMFRKVICNIFTSMLTYGRTARHWWRNGERTQAWLSGRWTIR